MADPMDVIYEFDGWSTDIVTFSISDTYVADLDDQLVTPGLIDAFDGGGVTLSETAIISVTTAGESWFICDITDPETAAIYTLDLDGANIVVSTEPNTYYIEDLKPGDTYIRGEVAPGPYSNYIVSIPIMFDAVTGANVGTIGSYDGVTLGPEVGASGYAWWSIIRVEALVDFTRGPHFLCLHPRQGVDSGGDGLGIYQEMVGGALVRGCRFAEDPGITTNSSYSDDWESIADWDPSKSWSYPGGPEGGVTVINDFPFDLPITGGSAYVMYMALGANGTISDLPGGTQLYSNGGNNHRIYNMGLKTTSVEIKATLSSAPDYPGGSVYLTIMRLNGDPDYVSDTTPPDDTGGGDDFGETLPALIVRNNVFSGGDNAIAAAGVKRVVFANNAVRSTVAPIAFVGCNYPVVTGNTASLFSLAVHLKDSYFASVTNNVFRDSGVVDYALYLENTHHTHVSENKVFNTDGSAPPVHAVSLDIDCTDCAVVNNDFRRGFSDTKVFDASATTYEIRNLPEDGMPGGGLDGGAPTPPHTHSMALDELTDVDAPSPAPGDALVWDGAAWTPQAGSGYTDEQVDDEVDAFLVAGTGIFKSYNDLGDALTLSVVLELNELTDVNALAPADGDALVWDAGAGAWVPTAGVASYTDDDAQDAIVDALTAGTQTGLSFVYDDTLNKLSLTVAVTKHFVLNRTGTLVVETGLPRFYVPVTCTITNVTAAVGTAPTGASVIVDINKNLSTIFTSPANRPTIAATTNADLSSTPNITALTAGDFLTVDIAQIGSSNAGTDLVVVIAVTVP